MKTMILLDRAPDWIGSLCSEIDTLDFGLAFERFTTSTILEFGSETYYGPEEIKAFFVKIDSPVSSKHRIIECWSGVGQHFIKGVAEITNKGNAESTKMVPFMWFIQGDITGPGIVSKWSVTAGPADTDSFL